MGQMLWTRRSGAELHAESATFRLVVSPAPAGGGFRYRVFARADDRPEAGPFASGSRTSAREAIEAAEDAVVAVGGRPAMAI